jgi:hypothetical protein
MTLRMRRRGRVTDDELDLSMAWTRSLTPALSQSDISNNVRNCEP